MNDPFLASATYEFRQSLNDLRVAIEGLDAAALNMRPAGDDSNSIAVLVVHSLSSTRSWLSVASGAPLPDRDRDSEFLATSSGEAELLAFVDELEADCMRLLSEASVDDWSALRATHARPNTDDEQKVSAAFALVHAMHHLGTHVGQVTLSRQLLDG